MTYLRKHKSGLHRCRDGAEYEYGSQFVFGCAGSDNTVPFLCDVLADLFELIIGAATATADGSKDTVGSLLLGSREVT